MNISSAGNCWYGVAHPLIVTLDAMMSIHIHNCIKHSVNPIFCWVVLFITINVFACIHHPQEIRCHHLIPKSIGCSAFYFVYLRHVCLNLALNLDKMNNMATHTSIRAVAQHQMMRAIKKMPHKSMLISVIFIL